MIYHKNRSIFAIYDSLMQNASLFAGMHAHRAAFYAVCAACIDREPRLLYNLCMKKYTIAAAGAIALSAAALIIIYALPVTFSADETTDALARDSAVRGALTVAMVALAALCCGKELFAVRRGHICADIAWCLPCLAVALANFPYSALITGGARIDRPELIWLFLIKCLTISASEELLFRGIALQLLCDVFRDKPHGFILTVAASSAAFGLFHLFNLAEGAALPATLLQVGYTFLTGMMFAAVTLKTGNIWGAMALHFIFDVGGLIVTDLGSGNFQDTLFWVLTAVCAAGCAVHLVVYALRRDRAESKRK